MAEDWSEAAADVETDLPDLTGLALAELEDFGPSALGHALRRVLKGEADPADPVVGFQASI
ncbi:MAG TPA: FxSxx-COOH cyclophane-containing RiPP peptide [Streptosporangiaceae bacterium]|jgi:FXSXX-COOH protein